MIAKDKAEKFVAYWSAQKGSERSRCHQFWDSLAVQIVPHATLYHFGVLTSKVHMAWMRTVCGRLEMRYRYSKEIVYNPFPWPDVANSDCIRSSANASQNDDGCVVRSEGEAVVEPNLPTIGVRSSIEKTAQAILDAREKYAGASFAELYGEKMYLFADLVAAHEANDAAVLKAYGWPPDLSEPEIVSRLFAMYAGMTRR